MGFDEWVDAVDTVLIASKRGVRAKDLDSDALEGAWLKGDSPVIFAKQPLLPVKTKTARSGFFSFEFKFLPWLLATLFVLVFGYFGKKYVTDFHGDKALKEAKYPQKLPLKTDVGEYYPEGALDAAEEAKEIIKGYVMTPRDTVAVFAEPVEMLAYGKFKVQGSVGSKNKYGTTIDANYEMVVYRKYMRVEGGYQLKDKQWLYEEPRLFASGDTNIWARGRIEQESDFGSDGVFRQAKTAAKKTANRRIYQMGTSAKIYSGDRDDQSLSGSRNGFPSR